jgi:hypothetical protein
LFTAAPKALKEKLVKQYFLEFIISNFPSNSANCQGSIYYKIIKCKNSQPTESASDRSNAIRQSLPTTSQLLEVLKTIRPVKHSGKLLKTLK